MPAPRRMLPGLLPNLRDCGGLGTEDGYLLRRRVLLRSAALSGLPPATVDALAATLGEATYVDLRTDLEVERDGEPDGLLARGWRWHRIPLQDKQPGDAADRPRDVLRRYRVALPRYLDTARQTAGLLCQGPVVVGCNLGKDRTGLVVALLLRWLGVRHTEIVEDFTLSNACLSAGRGLLAPRWRATHEMITPVSGGLCAAMLRSVDALGQDAEPPSRLVRLRRSVLEEARHATA